MSLTNSGQNDILTVPDSLITCLAKDVQCCFHLISCSKDTCRVLGKLLDSGPMGNMSGQAQLYKM